MVEEELTQFNDILKLVVAPYDGCKQYLEEEPINSRDKWLNNVDERVFSFKRKMHSWFKETIEDDVQKLHQRQRVIQVDLQEEVQKQTIQVAPNQT